MTWYVGRFLSGNARTLRLTKNIALSFVLRFIQIIVGLLLVPLALTYLDAARYGVWLTLSSIVGWFGVFDVGLGNGLRNKLSESLARGEEGVARNYISTAYISLLSMASFAFLIFAVVNPFLDWSSILNARGVSEGELSLLAIYVFGFFFLRLVLQLLNSIVYAIQQPAIIELIGTVGKLLNLAAIYVLLRVTNNSLLYLGISYSVAPVVVLGVATLAFFFSSFKKYLPSFRHFRRTYLSDILGLGGQFFVIQISAVILYSTDNLIISHLFSPEEVTPYQIASKYFAIVLLAFMIIITPFWSAITEAFTKKEYSWIKRSVGRLLTLWSLALLALAIMLIMSDKVYSFWIGDRVHIPFVLSLAWAVFVALQCLNAIFAHFLNGAGKIRLQLILSVGAAIINIPLSILLAKYLGLGVVGVIVATISTQVFDVLFGYLQYQKLINGTAMGIWGK